MWLSIASPPGWAGKLTIVWCIRRVYEVASNNSVKTDTRLIKNCDSIISRLLQGIHVPKVQHENYRCSRSRETLIRQRHRVGCQLKSLLLQQGLIQAEDDTKVR